MNKQQTRNIIRVGLLVGTIVSLYFVPWPLVKASIRPLPKTVQGQVDAALNYGFEGVIVYVHHKGEEPQYYAAGRKNRENESPADPHALFKIASIGKLYDAVAITKLISAGRLSLDSTLADYFPELLGRIENAEKITLRMLVQHRSGIPNVTDTPNFWTDPPAGRTEALERILDLPAVFDPGVRYAYSNTNYLGLSQLVEKTTGTSHFQFVQEVILSPLNLQNTHESIHSVNLDAVMSGYYVGVTEDIKGVDYGSMLATAEDVGIFLRALNDGSLLSAEEQKIYASLYDYEHTGLIPGYQSIAKCHSDIDAVVIQFTNVTDFEGYNWSLSEICYRRILKILRREYAN